MRVHGCGVTGYMGIQWIRVSDDMDMELHSQIHYEDLIRLTRAWRKLDTNKCNKTFEIVACCTGVIGK